MQAQYQETDASPAVLQYYNASNPSVPWYGPANAGTPQNTRRLGSVAIQLKAGTAVATGSQVAPSADAGWTGLATVTVANGATTITIGNVADLATGNTRPTLRLPQIGNGFGNELAAAGYQALPSGLIVQWGSYTGTPTVSDGIGYENTSIAVTFPIAFPTACYAVLATPIDATTGGAGGGYEGAWVAATNVSGFTGCVRFKNSGTAVTAYYLAVGK